MNIFAGRLWGWGWAEHKLNGKLGGDDMKATPGERIPAPVAGTVRRTAHTVTITEPDGWITQCLELGTTVRQTAVAVGDTIGTAGQLWPHWHSITPAGVRVRARFLTPKGVIEMLGLNYNVPGPKSGTKALYDPINKLVVYPAQLEQDVFTQSGGVFVNVNEPMWTQLLGGCRQVKGPAPIAAGAVAEPAPFTFTGTATPIK